MVVDLRYGILYVLHEGLLDLREAWVSRLIMERFQGYTHQNALRLHHIAVAHDDCIMFDLHLVDPDVAIQQPPCGVSDVRVKCSLTQTWRSRRLPTTSPTCYANASRGRMFLRWRLRGGRYRL